MDAGGSGRASPMTTASRRLAHERLEELLDEEGADLSLVLRLLNAASSSQSQDGQHEILSLLRQIQSTSASAASRAREDDRLRYYEDDDEVEEVELVGEPSPDGSPVARAHRGEALTSATAEIVARAHRGEAMNSSSLGGAVLRTSRSAPSTAYLDGDTSTTPASPSAVVRDPAASAALAAASALASAMGVSPTEAARALASARGNVERAMLRLAGGPTGDHGSPTEAKHPMQPDGELPADVPTASALRPRYDAQRDEIDPDMWGAHDLPTPTRGPAGRPHGRQQVSDEDAEAARAGRRHLRPAAPLSALSLEADPTASPTRSSDRPKTARGGRSADPFHYVVPSPERDRDAQAVATQVMSLEGGGAGRIVEDRRGGLDGDRIIEYADDRDEDDVAVGGTVLGNEEEEDEEDGGIGGGALAARPTDAVELERPKTARGGPGKDPFGYVSPGRPTRGTDHWMRGESSGTEPAAPTSPATRVAGELFAASGRGGDGGEGVGAGVACDVGEPSPARAKLEAARRAREAAALEVAEAARQAAAEGGYSPMTRARGQQAREALSRAKDAEERARQEAVAEDTALFEAQTQRLSPSRAGLVAAGRAAAGDGSIRRPPPNRQRRRGGGGGGGGRGGDDGGRRRGAGSR